MGDAGVGRPWIEDRLIRPAAFHGLGHSIVAFQDYALGEVFAALFLFLLLQDIEDFVREINFVNLWMSLNLPLFLRSHT